MSSSGKPACCFLLAIFLLFQQAVSLNVEQLCAQRCLYGRGGVLCNCNAIHFAGKRSDHQLKSAQHLYSQSGNSEGSGVTRGYPFLEESKVSALTQDDNLFPSVNMQDRPKHSYVLENVVADDLTNSWTRDDFERFLSASGRHRDLAFLPDEVDDLNAAGAARLPSVIFPRREERDPGRDNISSTRDKVASKVRQIMSEPFKSSGRQRSGNKAEDVLDKAQGEQGLSGVHSSQSLIKLEKVLTQALRGR